MRQTIMSGKSVENTTAFSMHCTENSKQIFPEIKLRLPLQEGTSLVP
jgi:hypothetical protein